MDRDKTLKVVQYALRLAVVNGFEEGKPIASRLSLVRKAFIIFDVFDSIEQAQKAIEIYHQNPSEFSKWAMIAAISDALSQVFVEVSTWGKLSGTAELLLPSWWERGSSITAAASLAFSLSSAYRDLDDISKRFAMLSSYQARSRTSDSPNNEISIRATETIDRKRLADQLQCARLKLLKVTADFLSSLFSALDLDDSLPPWLEPSLGLCSAIASLTRTYILKNLEHRP